MAIRATVDTHIRLDPRLLPKHVERSLCEALTLPNEAVLEARRRNRFAMKGEPDTIELYRYEHGELVIPRGFGLMLGRGLKASGLEVSWQLSMIDSLVDTSAARAISLRRHQGPSTDAILKTRQGVYWAPTGSGKTVTALEAWRRYGQRGIVLVEKSHLAVQWQAEAKKHLDIDVGIVGAGQFDDTKALTIAMFQTLHSRRDDLITTGWFDRFGFVCADECHHTPASTYADIIQLFAAGMRFGVSATPETGSNEFRVVRAVLGEVFHRTSERELEDEGIIVKPKIQIVFTKFDVDEHERKSKIPYEKLMWKLERDAVRSHDVAREIMSRRGRQHIVLSRRLEHLRLLSESLALRGYPMDRIFMLTGKESRDERDRVREMSTALDELVVFSTIGYEALDIPSLSVVHLVWPSRKHHIIQQAIGRVTRGVPGKTDACVIDYVDMHPVARSQFGARMKIYRQRGFDVEGLGPARKPVLGIEP